MKAALPLSAFRILFACLANAQTATVKRNVILRAKPSTSSDNLDTLRPKAKLTLINRAARNEFLGKPGNDEKKKALNTNKNRTDTPEDSAYEKIDWADLRDLPANHSEDLSGAPVVIEGVFLVNKVKPEGAESPNCGLTDPDEVDWHMYTSDTAGQSDISKAVIVETTARTRPLHKWVKSDLDAVVNKNVPVRISGWPLYDYEHIPVIGTQRASDGKSIQSQRSKLRKTDNGSTWVNRSERQETVTRLTQVLLPHPVATFNGRMLMNDCL